MKGERTPITPERATVRLEELCARAEHSTGEMRDKLRKWGITGDDADQIIAHLVKHRFVDDRRFAGIYVRDKVKFSLWGRRKIEQGLYQKRVSREIIKEALEGVDAEEYTENLRRLIHQKIKNTPSLLESYEGRTKIYRFIISRGYEPGLGAEVLRQELKNK